MDALSIQPPNEWLKPRERLDGMSLMDHLFNRLDGAYVGRWRSMFLSAQSVENWRSAWVEAFVEDGIRPEEIRVGISACRRLYDWPPSVGEFIKACRPPMDVELAFREAVEQMALRDQGRDVWSHPAIFWAASLVGAFDLRNSTWSAIRVRWTRLLQGELAKGEWPEVPARLDALPAPGGTAVDPGRVRSLVVGVGKNAGSREWALRVAERREAGQRVPSCAVKSASQVLGRPIIKSGKGARPDYADRAAGDRSHDEMVSL